MRTALSKSIALQCVSALVMALTWSPLPAAQSNELCEHLMTPIYAYPDIPEIDPLSRGFENGALAQHFRDAAAKDLNALRHSLQQPGQLSFEGLSPHFGFRLAGSGGRLDFALGVRSFNLFTLYYRSAGLFGAGKHDQTSRQVITFLKYLERHGAEFWSMGRVGALLRIDRQPKVPYSLWVFHGNNLSRAPEGTQRAYLNLPEDMRDFVMDQYKRRLNLTPADIQRLRSISEVTEQRSLYFAGISPDSTLGTETLNLNTFGGSERDIVLEPTQGHKWDDWFAAFAHPKSEHLKIQGAATIVFADSAKPEELLPLEMFTGFRVPRPEQGLIAEIGRYTVDKQAMRELSPLLAQQMAAAARSYGNVQRFVIEADVARARIFERYGFKVIHERKNYEGKREFIMTCHADEFRQAAIEQAYESVLFEEAQEASYRNVR